MIELEQYKLYAWAAAVGLLDDSPTLQVSDRDLRLVPRILEQLSELLSNLDKLKSDYGLHLELTNEELTEAETPQSMLGRFGFRRGEKFNHVTANAFHKRRGAWWKMKWVMFDEQRVRKLMDDVKYFTNELQCFLDQAMRERTAAAIDMLLRLAVLHSASQRALAFIGEGFDDASTGAAVAASARLKSKGLLLGVIDGPHVEAQMAELLALSNLQLSNRERPSTSAVPGRFGHTVLGQLRLTTSLLKIPEPTHLSLSRQLAYYEDKPVLIEWKSIDKTNSPVLHNRVARVSALLNEMTDPIFHSLPSRGYLRDKVTGRYGYAFNLPPSMPTTSRPLPHGRSVDESKNKTGYLPPLPSVTTLHELLRRPSVRPSLNFRLIQAITLLETILQLHTAGWLHKEIRSENMLFVHSGTDVSSPLFSNIPPSSECYVAGYVYARPDDPQDMTEPLASQLQADLYRHPQYLGSSRATYRKSFDIFSVGCVLLELGLWSSLADVLCRWSSLTVIPFGTEHGFGGESASENIAPTLPQAQDSDDGPDSNTDIDLLKVRHRFLQTFSKASNFQSGASPRELLEAQMGKRYTEVVMNFFLIPMRGQGDNDEAVEADSDLNEHEFALELEKSSLAHLRAIAAYT
jgi:hypothetical protein